MSSRQPAFSIIVASYNNSRYLETMIDSVLGQSYDTWELLIADDASTDDSLEVLSRRVVDERITVLRHSSNRGAGAAFATAAAAARGDVIGMLGADDALTSGAVERMIDAHIANPRASLINSDLVVCDSALSPTGQASPFGPPPTGRSLINECTVSSFATFKRSAYERTAGFDARFRRAVDHDIYLKLEEVGDLAYVHEPLYLYRASETGISQGPNGVLAAQYSFMARGDAYRRRLGTDIPNLTSREYRDLMSAFHRRQVQLEVCEGRLAGLGHLALSAAFRPGDLLDTSFWSVALNHAVRRRGA